ncbi:DUF1304 domain-containing protein [Secundilactobacillus malefermentans]|uniref:DUF1304 domain-containing protein n=1 Tax=Secundilactobacillus malefermentans TaxID=176292 RepID=A0A4R5NL75_9LACO|nr:DUF1304 domain-containing protein [Secundilactobacillus malefermentans]QEA31856.1 DUF1304 domain-containing protein [Secundilactobacillus malefermentans]TDG75419.1 hypothetical protein C5L31_000293 [Secundilactobacillus malefermentans]
MNLIIIILSALIGIEHIGIMGIEMFASDSVKANAFDMPIDYVKLPNTKVALGNQGIYNGMLGILIIATLFIFPIGTMLTFLSLLMVFIAVVALYGAMTATKKILFIQFLPAVINLALIILTFK